MQDRREQHCPEKTLLNIVRMPAVGGSVDFPMMHYCCLAYCLVDGPHKINWRNWDAQEVSCKQQNGTSVGKIFLNLPFLLEGFSQGNTLFER